MTVVPTAAAATAATSTLWADKYKPQSMSQMCYPTCANKLKQWMENFDAANPKYQKGALLSGPPGVGKTTSVYLVAKALNKQVIEYNASDFRSKKSLHESVSSVINNRVFAGSGFLRKTEAADLNFILLMDEVDGCDLGGVGEVISMIKGTKIPILCTCNDRWHPKLRSLMNYVEDIRFQRPPCNIVANFICENVLARERVSLPKQILQDIIKSGGSDIRSILNNLQVWCLKRNVLDQQTLGACARSSFKNGDVGLFEAAETFLLQGSSSGSGPKTVEELQSAYYNSDLVDLFVQENYLQFQPSQREWMGAVAQAAASISSADQLQRVMYVEQNWSVSNAYVLQSSIIPCAIVRGHFQSFATGQQVFFDRQRPVKFPSWLGQNSTAGKNSRLLATLSKQGGHPETGMSGTTTDVALDYIPLALVNGVTRPLVEKDKEGISDVMHFMDAYHLLRDDWDVVQDVCKFRRMETVTLSAARAAAVAAIATATKSAFTREFNKNHKLENFAKGSLKHMATINTESGGDYELGAAPPTALNNGEDGEENDENEDAASPTSTTGTVTTTSSIVSVIPKAAPSSGGGKRATPKPKAAPAAPRAKKAPAKRSLTFIDDS